MAEHSQLPGIALWVKCFLQSGELVLFVKNVFVCIASLLSPKICIHILLENVWLFMFKVTSL